MSHVKTRVHFKGFSHMRYILPFSFLVAALLTNIAALGADDASFEVSIKDQVRAIAADRHPPKLCFFVLSRGGFWMPPLHDLKRAARRGTPPKPTREEPASPDHPAGAASLRFSRDKRKRKNSAPSRARRLNMSALENISLVISHNLRGRK